MNIGDKVWVLEPMSWTNMDYPIRKRFSEAYIIGETRVSWIVGKSMNENAKEIMKCKKKKPTFYTNEEMEGKCWLYKNRKRIGHKVGLCENHDILKRIAELINYSN
ncbi:hypothetical protein [Bacillus sp. NPDC094106]|uniref:hypothetical protein n=1 Tax=Bacillus sp. NPDC094106 TaxID=3363949 RepID=UPI00380216B6